MELLVVISIMSLLMSIILPPLSRAREQAQRVVCLNNLKQLTIAWTDYAFEHDDMLCSAQTDWKEFDPTCWVGDGPMIEGNPVGGTRQALKDGALWPHVSRVPGVYKCKTDTSGFVRSFAMSRMMNGSFGPLSSIAPYRGYTGIPRPGEKVVFIDAASRIGWIDGSFWPFELTGSFPTWSVKDNINITERHANGFNAAFADTHCEYFKWRDRRTIKVAEWQSTCLADDSFANRDIEDLLLLLKGR